MNNIFLSYRRSDSEYATARIHDHLDMYFGERVTFRDVDGMYPGEHFPTRLENHLNNCQIAVIVIGSDWVTARDASGHRRLDDTEDFVRVEVRRLLERRTPVVPVLVGNAGMPRAQDLPEDLRPLAFVHALALPPSSAFRSAMQELVRQISLITGLHAENYPKTLLECQKLGLVTAIDSFQDDTTVRQEIRNCRELVVVMNDGRNFVDGNQELLKHRLLDPEKRTLFVFYHPASGFMPTLLHKNGKRTRQLEEMRASFVMLTRFGAREIRGHRLFNPYSLTMSENYAFVSPYRFNEGGALPLLKFSSRAPEGYYHVLQADAARLFDEAEPLTLQAFDEAATSRMWMDQGAAVLGLPQVS